MKKPLTMMALLMILAVPAFAKERDGWLNGLCFVACGTIFLDTALTYDWLARGGGESNPFWRDKLNRPGLVLTIDIGICLGIVGSSHVLKRLDGPWRYVIPCAVILIQSTCIYSHFKVRHWI